MGRINVKDCIRRLLDERGVVQASDVAEAAGITRQGAHYHLRIMAESGELVREGAGRGTRYRRASMSERRPSWGPGLASGPPSGTRGADTFRESDPPVWSEEGTTLPSVLSVPDRTRELAQYAFSEQQVFSQYTSSYDLSGRRAVIDLLAVGADLMARSEARCLMYGLGHNREIVIDFAGVMSLGEGFVDELFRVWARNHPDTTLMPINMAEPVQQMVGKARGDTR